MPETGDKNGQSAGQAGGKWRCSLCGHLVPADDLQDARKKRHKERHGRHGHNNIVYGKVTWSLTGGA